MKKSNKPFIALYLITFVVFFLYVTFFSDSNFARHRELNRQITNLESQIARTRNHISNENEFHDLVKDPKLLEKYGREQLDMHKFGEDVFIFVYE